MFDFIIGEKFPKLVSNNIIYSDTHNVNHILQHPPNHEFILVTHNSDGKILDFNQEYRADSADINLIPNNLVKWFAQNVCVYHEKIESIPIGLENSKWFVEEKKVFNIEKISNLDLNFKNLLYINFNINTNLKQRIEPINIFMNKSWATIKLGKNGDSFIDYITDVKSHKFVLCPEGNGTDTHRTWETLYLGSIPIEKRNINNSFYTDLPICFVDSWSDITEDFLNSEFERIKNSKWNLEKLKFSYWEEKITNYNK
jgi:hypothetical protein